MSYEPYIRSSCAVFHLVLYLCRERKRERDREDLWRKLEALSLTNARKEGISLDYINHVVRPKNKMK